VSDGGAAAASSDAEAEHGPCRRSTGNQVRLAGGTTVIKHKYAEDTLYALATHAMTMRLEKNGFINAAS
jgi:hypothetical protein